VHLHFAFALAAASAAVLKLKSREPFKMQLNPLTPLASLGMTRNSKLIAQAGHSKEHTKRGKWRRLGLQMILQS